MARWRAVSIGAAVVAAGLVAAVCGLPAEIGAPRGGGGPDATPVRVGPGVESSPSDGGDAGAGSAAAAAGPDAAGGSNGAAPNGRVVTIEGPVIGLHSESHAWLDGESSSPMALLYFQHGSQGGSYIYTGDDYGDANVWYDKNNREDPVEGQTSIWYRRPQLGADSPTLDANNASARLLWRTFDQPYDISAHRFVNLWVRPLDGFDGFLGITLASWDPGTGGGSGDDGQPVSRLFPQRVRGTDWIALSIELDEFAGFDPTRFAKYVIEFPGTADGQRFLIDNLSFSVNRPRGAGPPDPAAYALIQPGEDPKSASDRVTVRFDRSIRHQTIRGFGFFGDGPSRARLVDGLGASLIRVEIPAGDPPAGQAATRANTVGWEPINDDGDDRSFVTSLGGYDAEDVRPVVDAMRGFRAIDPEVEFFACAWSPPGWMKNGGQVNDGTAQGDWGNALRSEAIGEYGEYLAAFALHLHREGLPLLALSMGNEVHFNHVFPSMNLVGDAMLQAIRETKSRLDLAEHRVPGFEAPLLTTDDNVLTDFFFEGGFIPLLSGLEADSVAGDAVDVISYHSYGVDAQTPQNVPNTVLSRLRSTVDEKLGGRVELWMTETSGFHNGLFDEGDRRGALAMAEGIHTSLAYADAAAWVYLGSAELLHFGRLSWPGHILRHYARFVRPGAVRFEASVDRRADRVLVTAFEHSGGGGREPALTVVLVNTDDEPYGVDLSDLPVLSGRRTYRQIRSSPHHTSSLLPEVDPSSTAAEPFVLPPHAVVTLVQGPSVPPLGD